MNSKKAWPFDKWRASVGLIRLRAIFVGSAHLRELTRLLLHANAYQHAFAYMRASYLRVHAKFHLSLSVLMLIKRFKIILVRNNVHLTCNESPQTLFAL